MQRFLLASFLLVFFCSCNSNEIGDGKDVDPSAVWFEYRISGEEETGYVTVNLQYRFAGRAGTTLLMSPPSKVELDGEPLPADSSKMSGVYYEISRPIQDFAGEHTIVFTDKNNKQYKEDFTFQPMTLSSELGEKLPATTLELQLEGVAEGSKVRVILMDTASFSEGIDRIDTVRGGIVRIDSLDMATLAAGPVFLELNWEKERKVKNGTSEGGRISMSYRLRRQFELEKGQ
jgi:hypothetical protein